VTRPRLAGSPGDPVITLTQQGDLNNGWCTLPPTMTVTSTDPAASAGFEEDAITVSVDEADRSCPPAAPAGVEIGHGSHTATVIARSRGPAGQPGRADVHAPVPAPITPAPVHIALLGGAKLNCSVTDAMTPKVKISVIVHDALGNVVRRLNVPGPSPANPYVTTGSGSILWNDRDANGH